MDAVNEPNSTSSENAQVAVREILPSHVIPKHYDILTNPASDGTTFDGTVKITLVAVTQVEFIVLNAKGLEPDFAIIQYKDDFFEIPLDNFNQNTKLERWEISLGTCCKPMPEETFILALDYSGQINEYGAGLFRSPNLCTPGYMLSTEMEPTDARMVFPCFDEPALKATFSVSLIVQEGLTCLSNMPIESESQVPRSDLKRVYFEKTPLISTYLIAFAIGRFDMIQSDEFRVPVRIHAPKGSAMQDGQYALDIAVKALAHYEKLFDYDFPLPKMDLLVVPNAFSAMENWGIATFQPQYLLLGPDSKAADKIESASMICHELAHQWFGNLVTMTWWDDLWLKESFADWAAIHIRTLWSQCPDIEAWEDFASGGYQLALYPDSFRNTHPIQATVNRPSEISQIYDDITYKKGCSIINMLAALDNQGAENFKDGIRKYLKTYAYGNATASNLWTAIGEDKYGFLETWIKTPGYPLLILEETPEETAPKGYGYQVDQERFLITPKLKRKERKAWWPVLVHEADISREWVTLSNHRLQDFRPAIRPENLNQGRVGFHRVGYSSASFLQKIAKSFAEDDDNRVADRIGIIFDTAALAFARHRLCRTQDLLDLLNLYKVETNFFVWRTMLVTLSEIRKLLLFTNEDTRTAVLNFQNSLTSKLIHEKGWIFDEKEPLNEQRFKALLFGYAGGDKKVTDAALAMFKSFSRGDMKAINPNIRTGVFKLVLETRGIKEYRKLHSLLLTTLPPRIRTDILSSLGYSQHPASIQATLEIVLSTTSQSWNEVFITIRPLTTHKAGIEALWDVMKSKQWFQAKNLSLRTLAPIIEVILDAFTTMEQHEEVKILFDDIDTTGVENTIAQCLERIQARARWIEQDHDELATWLREHGYFSKTTQELARITVIKKAWKNMTDTLPLRRASQSLRRPSEPIPRPSKVSED
ncbi:hypothetical protein BP6252_04452 [Coleophoma cylindrospora]|uniref:Aminopeptidase n=1 Tax=Coleophoma cylindrospora TaxID=1849047 RepID=A0A3D8S147_9HELO|nr:hypothetical protein BP6252_04452 [Coleophoma cylindrospora]